MPQSFHSHVHRPVTTVIAGVLWLAAFILLVGGTFFGWRTTAAGVLLLALAVAPLIAISRQYIVRLQDRLIMLEMKVRCAEVLPAGQDARLNRLSKAQVIALRFASDEELGELLERAERERLSARDIKQAIRNWRPDPLRT